MAGPTNKIKEGEFRKIPKKLRSQKMTNTEIANILYEIADILEIQDANSFRISAHRRAAQTIESLPEDINQVYKRDKLDDIPGVGTSIAQKIKELIETGKLKELAKLEKKVPKGLVEMMEVEGIGPKLAAFVHKKFKVKNIDQLEKIVRAQKLRGLKGFGPKSEENILRGIELYRKHGQRMLLGKAIPQAQIIVEALKKSKLCQDIEVAGSLRRCRETIGDIDILVTSKKPKAVMDLFTSLPSVATIEAKGKTKSMVILKSGTEADVRVVEPKCFGAALQYFTGSKAHNIQIRKRAMERGLKINEYGVFKIKNNKRIAGKTEEEVYKTVGLTWMAPELREDRGEIEAALRQAQGKPNGLPKLIELKDIKGDLHIHTQWSDGAHTIEEIVKAAIKKGYQYIAITDHASPLGIIKGIAGGKIVKQLKEIAKLRKKYRSKIAILSGAEVDILPNGKLYLPEKVLKQLDIVIAAVHSKFKMNESEMTERILAAVKNPHVDIIAHPTGRILGKREPYPLDLDKLINECKKTNTILELNAFWSRLDLNDVNCRRAKDKGVKIAINTDAHNIMELEIMNWGISQARRGWLEKKDVINTLPLSRLKKVLK
jgi:DNA polymerase (family 10)